MAAITPPPRLETFFRDFFARLYAIHVEFDERRKQLTREKGTWNSDDIQDIYEKQCAIFEQVQNGVSGALQSLSDSESSIWKEGNTEQWVFYHCPGTDFYTLTVNNRRYREASDAAEGGDSIKQMIPSLMYFDVVAPADGEIQLIEIGRESPEWLENFEEFHECRTSATGPRQCDIERQVAAMEQAPLKIPDDYPNGIHIPQLPSEKDISFYRSFSIAPHTLLIPEEPEDFYQTPDSWYGPEAFIFWAAEKDAFSGVGEGILLPSASDAFYFFLMMVIPRISYHCDSEGSSIDISEYWLDVAKNACSHVAVTGNPEKGISLLGEALEKHFDEHEESAIRIYKPTSVHEYFDRRFEPLSEEILQKRYGLSRGEHGWTAENWEILSQLIETDALELPSHQGDSSSLPFGVKLAMFGDEPGFLSEEL